MHLSPYAYPCLQTRFTTSMNMHSNLWNKICSWVNKATADACYDYEEQEAPNLPFSRPLARFIITLLMINVAVIVSFILSFTSYPSSRTIRHWGTGSILKANTSHFGPAHLFCPCNKMPGKWVKGCYDMTDSFMKVTPRTTLETPSLLGPSSVARIIIPALQNNVNDILLEYQYLLPFNQTEDWFMLLLLKHILYEVADLFLNSSGSLAGSPNKTDFLYWKAFNQNFFLEMPTGNVKAMELTGNRALGMEMNWTAYMFRCSPIYCDAVVHNSGIRRFFSALTDVGGFSTIVLVLLRFVVWPLLRNLCGWDLLLIKRFNNLPHLSSESEERSIEEQRLSSTPQSPSV